MTFSDMQRSIEFCQPIRCEVKQCLQFIREFYKLIHQRRHFEWADDVEYVPSVMSEVSSQIISLFALITVLTQNWGKTSQAVPPVAAVHPRILPSPRYFGAEYANPPGCSHHDLPGQDFEFNNQTAPRLFLERMRNSVILWRSRISTRNIFQLTL